MTTLTELLERVRDATGPDRELDLEIARALVPDVVCLRFNKDIGENEPFTHWHYTASIDAALALVEKVLPDMKIELLIHPRTMEADCGLRKPDTFWAEEADYDADGRKPPLAILAALLQAKIAEEER